MPESGALAIATQAPPLVTEVVAVDSQALQRLTSARCGGYEGGGKGAAAGSADVHAMRREIDTLKSQMRYALDMIRDQQQALIFEAKERAELLQLLQTERKERARDKQDLVQALQSECNARADDVRELAKSLQAECTARASETEQLARLFQAEREARADEVEDLLAKMDCGRLQQVERLVENLQSSMAAVGIASHGTVDLTQAGRAQYAAQASNGYSHAASSDVAKQG